MKYVSLMLLSRHRVWPTFDRQPKSWTRISEDGTSNTSLLSIQTISLNTFGRFTSWVVSFNIVFVFSMVTLTFDTFSCFTHTGPMSRFPEIVRVHTQKLNPRPQPDPTVSISASNLLLGQRKHFANLASFFASLLDDPRYKSPEEAIRSVLNEYLPKLSTGVAGAAFHAFILLGFGCEFKDKAVVADGLGYLCYAFADVGQLPSSNESLSAAAILQGLKREVEASGNKATPPRPGFMGKVTGIAGAHGALVSSWAAKFNYASNRASKLRDLDLVAALLFAGTPTGSPSTLDFFLCHGLTSLHALHCILPFLEQALADKLVADYFHGFCYLYLAQGAHNVPTIASLGNPAVDPWPEAREIGIGTDDEHVCKAITTLRHREFEAQDEEARKLFTAAAERVAEWYRQTGGRWRF